MRKIAIVFSILVMSGAASIAVQGNRSGPLGITSPAAQDPMYLDRRISLLEQRLNILESNVSRLQQQAMAPAIAPTQPARNPENELLRSELEILKSHLREVRCGVAHLDERTLSAAAKEAQKRSGAQTTDPCRQFPDSPVTLTPIR
ncbi:MAG TPA: hypothetical protein VLM38_10280 [Blastocatellia bacterium]|nr:hypothetical protein [Blastocatellia bacterium]